MDEIEQVANGLRLRGGSNLPIKERGFRRFGSLLFMQRVRAKFGPGGTWNSRWPELQRKELQTYGEDTQEWEEAQLMYEQMEEHSERQISLGLGFGGTGRKS